MQQMEQYSDDELQKINEAFWASDGLWLAEKSRLPCPRCGAHADIVFLGATFGSPAGIDITCYSCKTEGQVAAVSEQQGEFPPEKTAEYVQRHLRGLDAYCCFCHTCLSFEDIGTFEGMSYLVQCPRCAATGQAEP